MGYQVTTSAYTLVSVVLLGLSLSACDKVSKPDNADVKAATTLSKGEGTHAPGIAQAPPLVVIETGSPDLAVKSWWRVFDLKGKIDAEECNVNKLKEKAAYIAYFPKVAQEDVLRALTPKETVCRENIFERDIQEVKAESETRALVFVKVKNITPAPAGAEPDEYDKQYRKDGFRFKYLVEKTSEGWKVSQVYKYQEVNVILKRDPWEKPYKVREKPDYPAFVHLQ